MEPKCPEYSLVVVNPMESVQWVDKCDVLTAIDVKIILNLHFYMNKRIKACLQRTKFARKAIYAGLAFLSDISNKPVVHLLIKFSLLHTENYQF
jgi:hypothetical protein